MGGFFIRVLLLGNLSWLAAAAEYQVSTWGVDEGLPQSSVTTLAQTPDGFLWIGTLYSGFSRFDGQKFVNFDASTTEGFKGPGVRRLVVDEDGNLWLNDTAGNLLLRSNDHFLKIGSNFRIHSLVSGKHGRVVFNSGDGELIIGLLGREGRWVWQKQKPFKDRNELINYFEDSDGVFWFQTPEDQLGRFIEGRFEVPAPLSGLRNGKVQTLASDSAGRIWVGTETQVGCIEHGHLTDLTPASFAGKFSTRRIIPSVDHGVWVEGARQFFLYEQGQWSPPIATWDSAKEPWSRSRSYRADPWGGFWISLDGGGLVHVDHAGQLVRLTSSEGLPGQLIQVFFTDRDGNFWLGYHRGGLAQIHKEMFHTLGPNEGLQDPMVTSLAEGADHAIWVGSASGLVARWSLGRFEDVPLPILGGTCRDVLVARGPDGRIWALTSGNGLLVFENGKFHHALPPELVSKENFQLLVTDDGSVWFAGPNGLYCFDGQTCTRMLDENHSRMSVSALARGTDGNLWIGTSDGTLKRLHQGKMTSYRPADTVPDTRFCSLFPESDNSVWIGTQKQGLVRFNDGMFERYPGANGFADYRIAHILSDDFGNLWLSSRSGILCVPEKSLTDKTSDSKVIPNRLFTRHDGLPTSAMMLEFQSSSLKASDGKLWFGSPKGVSWLDPGRVRPVQKAPLPRLESLTADSRPVELIQRGSVQRMNPVIIESEVKVITLEFTAPDFIAPERVHFKYQIDSAPDQWVELGLQRSVTFNQLAPGAHLFRVTAKNSDGLWSEQPAELNLFVKPHFWQKTTFRLGVILAILLLTGLISRTMVRQRYARQLLILQHEQQLERERARIARDLHDDLGAGLTEISMASDLATSTDPNAPESRQYLMEIGTRSRELVQRLDEIVWAINPRNDSVASLSGYACEYAEMFLQPLGIECDLDLQPALPGTPLDTNHRYSFFLAFKETINNIARHADATTVKLSIRLQDRQLHFVIADNGKGFAPQAGKTGSDGLRNIRERIHKLGGICEITSQPGHGTRVALSLPLPP